MTDENGHRGAPDSAAASDDQTAPADGALPGTELARRAPATIAKRPATGLARPMAGRRRAVLEAGVIVGRAATHRRTRDAARWLLRNTILYFATGAWVLARRGWEARTNARYERLMRAAEAAGDYDRLIDWERAPSRRGSGGIAAGWTGSPRRSTLVRTAAVAGPGRDRGSARARRGPGRRALRR